MGNRNAIRAQNMALDALMAAACHTGELDPISTHIEQKDLEELLHSLSARDKARFSCGLKDSVQAIRQRVSSADSGPIAWKPIRRPEKMLLTAGLQERDAVQGIDRLRRARQRMRNFLGSSTSRRYRDE
jgi:hypothetical protein